MQEIQIAANEAGQRLDKLLAKYLSEAPKSFLYKMLRKKKYCFEWKKSVGKRKTCGRRQCKTVSVRRNHSKIF